MNSWIVKLIPPSGRIKMRYLPITENDKKEMLKSINMASMEAMFSVIPEEYRLKSLLDIPLPLSEMELMQHMEAIASQNSSDHNKKSFIGEITFRHFIPSIVGSLSSLPQFYTAYTPYQPEVSQGTLQTIYEFQSMMTNLTDMDLTNASMYDGATSAAEAMLMICTYKRKNKVLISDLIHPHVKEVLQTYANMNNIQLQTISSDEGSVSIAALENSVDKDTALFLVQSPNVFGVIEDFSIMAPILREKQIACGAIILESLSLGILRPPGHYGVDVTVGEAQSFGMSPNLGGPGLGFFSTRKEYIRKIPGRIVGKTTDDKNRTAYVMTLRAREQDIRREKATSNICTNHALCALMATIYLAGMGEVGLRKLAQWNVAVSHYAYDTLNDVPGLKIPFRKPFFNEFVVELGQPAENVAKKLESKGILLSGSNLSKSYPYLKNPMVLSFTELNHKEEIDELRDALKEALQ